MNRKFTLPAVVLACCLVMAGCLKKEITDFAGVKLSPTLAFPLGKVKVVLENVLDTQDSLLTVNADNSLAIRYRRDSVVHLKFSDLVDNIAGNWSAAVVHDEAIGKVTLDPIAQQSSITLGAVMSGFSDAAVASTIQMADGGLAPIPPFSGSSTTLSQVPSLNSFSEIQIDTMQMVVTITNGFPFDIQNLVIELIDQENGQAFNFPALDAAAGQNNTTTFELTNVVLHDNLAFRIASIESPGTNGMPVPIDLTDELLVDLSLEQILITSGVAVIPPVTTAGNATFDLETGSDARIEEITLGTNQADYTITSTLPFPIQLQFTLPSATIGGTPVQASVQIPAQGQVSQTLDLSNATIDLAQDPDQPYNRIPVTFQLTTMPPAGMSAFNASDGITLELSFPEIKIVGARGYFGQIEQQIDPDEIAFDFDFSFIDESSGPIFFDDATLTFEYENSFGFPFEADIDLVAHGRNGQTAQLNAPTLTFDYPPVAQAGTAVQGSIVFDGSNSGIVDLLSVYPTKFVYSGTGRINPQGDQGQVNYVLPDSYLLLHVAFDTPVRMRAQNIVVKDTLEQSPQDSLVGKIASAELVIDYRNGFPFTTTLSIRDLQSGALIVSDLTIPAASVDASGRATGSNDGRTTLVLTTDEADLLFASDQLEITVQVATTQNGQVPVALYTDYMVEVGLGARVTLNVEQGF